MSGTRLWQPATVVAVEAGHLTLRFDSPDQCRRCLRGEGCGAGVFTRLFVTRPGLLELASDQSWRVGQRVRVGLTPHALAGAALRLYGLPLVAFIAGAVIGQALVPAGWAGDLAALILGLSGAAFVIRFAGLGRWKGMNPELEALSCNSIGCEA